MLTIQCPKCRASMLVDEKLVGKRGRCTKCQEVFAVAAPAAAAFVGATNPFVAGAATEPAPSPAAGFPRPNAAPSPPPFGANPFLHAGLDDAPPSDDAEVGGMSFIGKASAAAPRPAAAPALSTTPAPPTTASPTPISSAPTRPPTPVPAVNPFASSWESPLAPPPVEAPVEEVNPSAAFIPEPEPAFVEAPQSKSTTAAQPLAPTVAHRQLAPTVAAVTAPVESSIAKSPAVILEVAAPTRIAPHLQKVTRLEAKVVRYQCKNDLTLAAGSLFRKGKTTTRLLVKAVGEGGEIAGWGEAHPSALLNGETLEGSLGALRRQLRPVVEGQMACEFGGMRRRMDRALAARLTAASSIKSAVESACMDLWARTLDAGLSASLFGGKPLAEKLLAVTVACDPKTTTSEALQQLKSAGVEWLQVRVSTERFERSALQSLVKSMPAGVNWLLDVEAHFDVANFEKIAKFAEDLGAWTVRRSSARQPDSPESLRQALDRERPRCVELRPTLLGWSETVGMACVASAAGLPIVIALQYETNVGVQYARQVMGFLGMRSTSAVIVDAGVGLVEDPVFGAVGPVTEGVGLGAAVNDDALAPLVVDSH